METAVIYSEQLTLFDYDSLDSETRIIVQQKTSEIKTLMRRTAQDIIDIGEKLHEVKEKLSHNKAGGFDGWLKAEFDWSRSTAYTFINVWESFANCPTVGQLDIAPKALYLLSSASTPEIAREKALEAAANGEKITYTKAKEIKSQVQAEAQAKLKGLTVGDYVTLYKGNTGKILESTGKSALVKHLDSDKSESLPITPDYFLGILSIPEEAWYSGDEPLGIYLGKALGVEVYLICEDGNNVGVQCRTKGEFDVALLGNWSDDYPQIFNDSDWWLLQAKKFLANAYPEDEEEEAKTHGYQEFDSNIPFEAWAEVEELAKGIEWKQNYKGHRIYIDSIKKIVARIQIKTPLDSIWSCYGWKALGQSQSEGLNLGDFDEEWAFDNATLFVNHLIETQSPAAKKEYPHGHLKATPKPTGDSVQKHPSWDKFGIGQIVQVNILGEVKTGRILAKENAAATVEIDGLGIKISYSELTPWAEANNVHFSSESVEWYTPAEIIKRVRNTLGEISLDPASCDEAQRVVNALCHLTLKQDGLSGDWSGKVFLNPPYGKEIGKWIQKLVAEYESKAISEAIALVPARTDTEWFQLLAPYTLCLIKGRLKFWNSQGEADNTASFPSAVVYLGKSNAKFVENFSALGGIWRKL